MVEPGQQQADLDPGLIGWFRGAADGLNEEPGGAILWNADRVSLFRWNTRPATWAEAGARPIFVSGALVRG